MITSVNLWASWGWPVGRFVQPLHSLQEWLPLPTRVKSVFFEALLETRQKNQAFYVTAHCSNEAAHINRWFHCFTMKKHSQIFRRVVFHSRMTCACLRTSRRCRVYWFLLVGAAGRWNWKIFCCFRDLFHCWGFEIGLWQEIMRHYRSMLHEQQNVVVL